MNMYEKLLDDITLLGEKSGFGEVIKRIIEGEMPTLRDVLDYLTGNLLTEFSGYSDMFVSVVAILLIAAFIGEISEKMRGVSELVASLLMALTILKSNFFAGDYWMSGNGDISVFVKAFVPIFAAVCVLSGNLTLSTVYGAAALLCMEIFSFINNAVLVPCINIVLSYGIVSGTAGSEKSGRLLTGFKKLLMYVMSGLAALVLGLMSMNGFAAGGTDTLMYKTGKFLSGSAIPGIGSTVSSSFETAKACFDAAGSIIGVSGMLVITMIAAPYIIRAVVIVFAMSVLSILSDILNMKKITFLFESIKTVCTLIISSYALELLVLVSGIALMLVIGG
ncbi:MAG: hypothetical protein Q4A45_02895 [Clostridia bacterium]|nr:hypothetical protein [Clostridia bacterium]